MDHAHVIREIPKRWWRWLLVAGGLLMLDALSVMLFPHAHARLFYTAMYGRGAFDTLPEQAQQGFAALVIAMAGLEGAAATCVAFIAARPFRRGEQWAWWAVALGTVAWVVAGLAITGIMLEGEKLALVLAGSVYYGLLLWPPVIFSYRHFHHA